jgi:hypothetical protein
MVNITIEAAEGITHKVWEKAGNEFSGDPGVLRYYFYGPGGNPSKNNELGCFDLKGRYAGKFKPNDGAKKTLGVVTGENEAVITLIAPSGDKVFLGAKRGPMSTQDRITLGMCITTALIASSIDAENVPQNLVQKVYDLADSLLAEYENRYGEE